MKGLAGVSRSQVKVAVDADDTEVVEGEELLRLALFAEKRLSQSSHHACRSSGSSEFSTKPTARSPACR